MRYFAQKFARRMNKRIDSDPDRARWTRCRAIDWPGNIRELENFIERAVILSRGSTLDAPLDRAEAAPAGRARRHARDR